MSEVENVESGVHTLANDLSEDFFVCKKEGHNLSEFTVDVIKFYKGGGAQRDLSMGFGLIFVEIFSILVEYGTDWNF